VAQLVEERHDFVVLQQARLLGCWLGEVAYQCGRRVASIAGFINESLDELDL
jgi:hypothetical protein